MSIDRGAESEELDRAGGVCTGAGGGYAGVRGSWIGGTVEGGSLALGGGGGIEGKADGAWARTGDARPIRTAHIKRLLPTRFTGMFFHLGRGDVS